MFGHSIILEIYKKRVNKGKRPTFWFWQDQHNNEVDLLIEENGTLKAIEIKSSQTYNTRLISGLKKWQSLTGTASEDQFLVFAGSQNMALETCRLIPWRDALEII